MRERGGRALGHHPSADEQVGDLCLALDPLLVQVDRVDELVELGLVPVLEEGQLLVIGVPEVLGVRLEDGIAVLGPLLEAAVPDAQEEGDLLGVLVVPTPGDDEVVAVHALVPGDVLRAVELGCGLRVVETGDLLLHEVRMEL